MHRGVMLRRKTPTEGKQAAACGVVNEAHPDHSAASVVVGLHILAETSQVR